MIPDVVGSNPIAHPKFKVSGPLAQLVEQLTLNQLVVGSNPTRPTTETRTPVDIDRRFAFLGSLRRGAPMLGEALVLQAGATLEYRAFV